MSPMVPNPLAYVTNLTSIGPIPEDYEELPLILNELSNERHVNNVGELWHLLMYFWPSCMLPPYPVSESWIWVWYIENGDIVWELASVM